MTIDASPLLPPPVPSDAHPALRTPDPDEGNTISLAKGCKIAGKQDRLREVILGRIHSGAYSPRIPNVRAMALELGANFKTVGKVLDRLAEEGVIQRRRGTGTTVCQRPTLRIHCGNAAEHARISRAAPLCSPTILEGTDDPLQADVVRVIASSIPYTAGEMLPLDDLAEQGAWRAMFPPAILDSFRVDGSLYALPTIGSPVVLYVNRRFFEERRLDFPPPDAGLGDWLALARTNTRGAVFLAPPFAKFTLPFLWQAGLPMSSVGALLDGLAEPTCIGTLVAYRELSRLSWADRYQDGIEGCFEAFLSGHIGMMQWGAALFPRLGPDPLSRFDIKPLSILGRTGTSIFAEGYGIHKRCTQVKAAKTLLSALQAPDFQASYAADCVPTTADSRYRHEPHPLFASELQHASVWHQGLPPLFAQLFSTSLEQFLQGEEHPDSWLQKLRSLAGISASTNDTIHSWR